VCGMWGMGIEEVRKDEEIHCKLLGDGKLSCGIYPSSQENWNDLVNIW